MPTDQQNSAIPVPADMSEGMIPAPGGASPNAPIDTGVDAGDANVAAEARVLATESEVEAHPS